MSTETAPSTNEPVRLSDAQLGEMLALAREADSVELKLTVPDTARRAAFTSLGMDPLDAQIRQVYFFDTRDLVLDRHGLVLRARRVQGQDDDSVVKLRPVVPATLAAARTSKNLTVEVDAMPGGFVCSASMKSTFSGTEVKEVGDGRRPIRKVFSKEQRAFFAEHAPEGIEMDELAILGPITLLKLKFTPPELGRKMVGELFYPDGSNILELSTKAAPGEAFQVAAEAKAYLQSRGVDLTGEQQTKTRTALEFFSKNP